jgi:hypothetical protein
MIPGKGMEGDNFNRKRKEEECNDNDNGVDKKVHVLVSGVYCIGLCPQYSVLVLPGLSTKSKEAKKHVLALQYHPILVVLVVLEGQYSTNVLYWTSNTINWLKKTMYWQSNTISCIGQYCIVLYLLQC